MTSIIDHPVRSPYAGVLTNIEPGSDVVSALAQANLLWGVSTAPVQAVVGDGGEPIALRDKAAILRDLGPLERPVPLGVVGAGYVPISNLDAYSPLQPLIDQEKLSPVQGGMTKDGRHTFLLCALSEGTTMLDVDPHQRFIMARTSHDGTGALRLAAWNQRLFCTNQIPALVTNKSAFVSIHHGRGAAVKVEALAGMLQMLVGSLDTLDAEWRTLAAEHVMPGDTVKFVEQLFPMPHGHDVTERMRRTVVERRTAVRTLATLGGTNANIAFTKAALVAAATEWDQWYRGKDATRRTTRLLEGGSMEFTRRAFDVAWAL